VEGSCEHGNDSIKCWEILEWLRNWRLLKKDSTPWSLLDSVSHTQKLDVYFDTVAAMLAFNSAGLVSITQNVRSMFVQVHDV
jgi:hypothetical protein